MEMAVLSGKIRVQIYNERTACQTAFMLICCRQKSTENSCKHEDERQNWGETTK
jgi:hypothetical protein